MGEAQCFGQICFTVAGVDQVPGLVAGDPGRVERVEIRVANRGKESEADGGIAAYLVDSRGRRWEPLPGLSGNRLGARVAGGSQMVSRPMFRVVEDSTGLGLVLTHGDWQWRRLAIGDPESLGHKAAVVPLGR